MSATPDVSEALGRLRSVFRGTAGVELTDTDLAELAGLDAEECRILLGVLLQTGAIERPRNGVFVCRPPNRRTSAPVRS